MSNLNQEQIQMLPIKNQLIVQGNRGPLAARIVLDFTATQDYDLDLQQMQSTNQFDLCQTIFIDNADGGAALTITINGSGQRIVAKAGTQGYYNVLCPNPIKLHFNSAGGAICNVFLIDVAIPGAVWPTT